MPTFILLKNGQPVRTFSPIVCFHFQHVEPWDHPYEQTMFSSVDVSCAVCRGGVPACLFYLPYVRWTEWRDSGNRISGPCSQSIPCLSLPRPTAKRSLTKRLRNYLDLVSSSGSCDMVMLCRYRYPVVSVLVSCK
jgi:hypothetical protein